MAVALTVAACSTDESSSTNTSTTSVSAQRDDALAGRLPDDIAQRGTLIVGTHGPYAPMVFTDHDGTYVGFDIDVVTAVGEILGVRIDLRPNGPGQTMRGVAAGDLDLGAQALFDTFSRERTVDMVTYFSGGTQWARRAGDDIDPNNACGSQVGVEAGSVQDTIELPAKSAACTALGDKPIAAVAFDSQDEVTAALIGGRVDAITADSPVIAYEVRNSDGKLATAGYAFDTTPYAMPVVKGSELGPVLRDVIQQLIDSGQMARIAARWGLHEGLIDRSTINAATS